MDDSVDKWIWDKVRPIFEKELGEKLQDYDAKKGTMKFVWRPNNYRRNLEVRQKELRIIDSIKAKFGEGVFSEHTKLIHVHDYRPQITIQYGKNTLTAIYSQPIIKGMKMHYILECCSLDELQELVTSLVKIIREKMDSALTDFVKEFDLRDKYQRFNYPAWDRYEDFIRGEKFIESIPEKLICNTSIFKKVYGKGIEFKDKEHEPGVHVETYIHNAVLSKMAPEISGAIHDLAKTNHDLKDVIALIPMYQEQLQGYAEEIKNHRKVQELQIKNQEQMNLTLKKLNRTIRGQEQRFLSQPSGPVSSCQSSLLQFCGV